MGLTIGGPCETEDGPGTVVSVRNATHWDPAWIVVEFADGRRKTFRGGQVWEPQSRPAT